MSFQPIRGTGVIPRAWKSGAPSFLRSDLEQVGKKEIAEALYGRMKDSQKSMPNVDKDQWVEEFIAGVEAEKTKLKLSWEAKWKFAVSIAGQYSVAGF